jgi:hypothetical protein
VKDDVFNKASVVFGVLTPKGEVASLGIMLPRLKACALSYFHTFEIFKDLASCGFFYHQWGSL